MDSFPRIFRPQKDDPGAVARAEEKTEIRIQVPLLSPRLPQKSGRVAWRALDLVTFYGASAESRIIEWGTRGPSHVAIVLMIEGRPLLYESTTLCPLPCELCDRLVQGVQAHTPEPRIAAYDGPVYRLPLLVPLSAEESERITEFALAEFPPGTPYDLLGALASGPRWQHWHSLLPYPDLGSIFCSALAKRLLMVANRSNWDDAKTYSPARLVRTQRRCGLHGTPARLNGPEVTRAA